MAKRRRSTFSPSFAALPSDLHATLVAFLTESTDRQALFQACRPGRDAIVRGSSQIMLRFPPGLPRAVIRSRTSSLSLVSRLRPTAPLKVQLKLTGDEYKRFSDRAAWLLSLCVAEAGANRTWEVTLKGLLLGNQLVPDYLATSCPNMSSLQLAGCYITAAAPRARRARQPGGVAHAALQRLTINGGVKSAGDYQLSKQQLTDTLHHQLPSLPALHSVVIKLHSPGDCDSIPHIGVMGPQLHNLHYVETSDLDLWRDVLEGQAASLTHLTHLHVDTPGLLFYGDMQLLLQLSAVTHLTIPRFRLKPSQSLAHVPCSWQVLAVAAGSRLVGLPSFLRLPLATLRQPVQVTGTKAGHLHFHACDGSPANMQALAVHVQHCGGFSWPGLRVLAACGNSTELLAAALPLLPRVMPQIMLVGLELSQPLIGAMAHWFGTRLSVLILADCHLHPHACVQLLSFMPHLSQGLTLVCTGSVGLSEALAAALLERLHDSVVDLCRAATKPLRLGIAGRLLEQGSSWPQALQAAVRLADTRGLVHVSLSPDTNIYIAVEFR